MKDGSERCHLVTQSKHMEVYLTSQMLLYTTAAVRKTDVVRSNASSVLSTV